MSFFATLLVSSALNTAHTTTPVTFCYENRELLPHYAKPALQSDVVPAVKPGAAIEILQQLDKDTPSVTFTYVRMPWKRCLKEIKQGKVDAVIGRFTPERQKFSVFPITDEQPDPKRAFSVASGCLVYNNNHNIKWDGKTITLPKLLTMALPRGYSSIERYKNMGFDVYVVDSLQKAQELLLNDKVDASIAHCGRKDFPKHITINPLPINSSYGYLVFSKQFYAAEKEKIDILWKNLSKIDKQSFYDKYL